MGQFVLEMKSDGQFVLEMKSDGTVCVGDEVRWDSLCLR